VYQPARSPAEPSEFPIQDGYFYTSDHVKLHYLEAGQGLALVFIPGWLLPADIWRPQLEGLSQDYHVIALDPRSQGLSDITPRGDEPLRQAQDIQELLYHLRLTSVVLVGWSHGGFQVLAYMGEFGTDRLYAAVLVDSALAAAESPASSPAQARFLQEYKADPPRATRGFVWSLFKTPPEAKYIRALGDAAARTPPDIALALLNNVFPGDAWQPSLKTICQIPLLYAVTPKFTAQSQYLSQVDPLARVEIFQNSGHALFYDESDRFNALLRDFLGHASRYPAGLPQKAQRKKAVPPGPAPVHPF
jgi:microsomal epoxide hydrolase